MVKMRLLSGIVVSSQPAAVVLPEEVAPATQMEGCVHTIKKAYRKRAADEFIRVLSQSNAVMERAYNWLNQ